MKPRTPRSAAYLGWIRDQACCVCYNGAPSQAAHVRIGGHGGVGLKPSDFRAVPLCARCHGIQHQYGERSFWAGSQKDPEAVIEALNRRFNFPPPCSVP